MARSMETLAKDKKRVKKVLRDLDDARSNRDTHIREAIGHGVAWRDAAEAAGVSTVQVGKIMKRPDPTEEETPPALPEAPSEADQRAVG